MFTRSDLISKLDSKSINYHLLNVDADSYSVDDHVKALGIKYSEGLSTLIYINEKQEFIVALRRDDRSTDINALCRISNSKTLKLCSESELNSIGFNIGLVSPVFLNEIKQISKILVDDVLIDADFVVCGSTDSKMALKIKFKDLLSIIGNYSLQKFTTPNLKRQNDMSQSKTIVSGITPSGNALHIGNYFGAAKRHVDLQNTADKIFLFVADVHALTTVKDKQVLENNVRNVVLDYLAFGVDPQKAIFFRQSDIDEHMYLNTVLANYVSYGHMQRMHAFKDKLQKGFKMEDVNMGLFNYPILMAADILVYKPDTVPVGEDQRQHVELTRDIAEAFNKAVKKDIFPLPAPYIDSALGKVIGTDGQRKMSKSLGNVIGIFDDETVIKKQIMSCYTDPNRLKPTDPGKVEGNTVFTYHDLLNTNKAEVEDLKNRYRLGQVGDVEVKEKLLKAHLEYFKDIRAKRKYLAENPKIVDEILASGAAKAKSYARATLNEVLDVIGLRG